MEDEHVISESEKKKEDWMNSKWRPMMGWMYMAVCAFDFVLAPVLWSLTQALFHGGINVQWQPLTLQGAGLFHISMGAVLGLAAYGRTQEKLAGANNGGLSTSYVPPTSNGNGFSSNSNQFTTTPPTPAFGSSTPPPPAFGSTPSPTVSTGFAGKKAPPTFDQPAL